MSDDPIKAALDNAMEVAQQDWLSDIDMVPAIVAAFLRALPNFTFPPGAHFREGPLMPQMLAHLAAAVERAAQEAGGE